MENLRGEYSKRKEAIKARLADFSRVKEDNYFYEMCFCICTPQSSAFKSDKAVKFLIERDFKNKKIEPSNFLVKAGVRFHKNKGEYLKELKEKYPTLLNKIKETKDQFELREFLVDNVKGYGYKEASHFLRNIGKRDLAILDRHILKNLKDSNAIEEFPRALTKKKYLELEGKFKQFANKVKIPIDELDLLFWSQETGEIFK